MSTSGESWFVEDFRLRSPVEEFQEYARLEVERLRGGQSNQNDAAYHRAVDLVLRKLRGERTGEPS